MALGHVRIAEGPGTQSDIDDANPNAQSLMLVGSGGSANALMDASRRTVSANHVTLASRRRVACVSRD